MNYKKQYTPQEIQDLIHWFKERMYTLPKSFSLDKATFSPDLQKTVKALCEVAAKNQGNPTFSGQIAFLFRIKDKLTNTSETEH